MEGLHLVLALSLAFLTKAENITNTWALIVAKQHPYAIVGHRQAEGCIGTFSSSGKPAPGTGLTNKYNNHTAIFGKTDATGYARIQFQKSNVEYDFHVYDPPHASAFSPSCYWEGPGFPNSGYYWFELQFMMADNALLATFPSKPAYHFDGITGLNGKNSQVGNYSEAQISLSSWATTQAQTFTPAAGQNCILTAKGFMVRGSNDPKFHMYATVHESSPSGPVVGPKSTTISVYSNEFIEKTVSWPAGGVRVTPGKTYAVVFASSDGKGFNSYATKKDMYPAGELYNGDTPVPGRDLVGMVVAGRCS